MKCMQRLKTRLVLLGAACFMLLIAYNSFAEEAKDAPLKFLKVYSSKNDGTFKLVPADNRDPASLTGLRMPTTAEREKLSKIPKFEFNQNTKTRKLTQSLSVQPLAVQSLPTSANNAANIYFRPIFSQEGNSCVQASSVGYMFTYEIDLARNLPANLEENQYPSHYTYNFGNGGYDEGSYYWSGLSMIRDNGCPNVPTWGGMGGDYTRWMSGYDKYYSAMHNRLQSYMSITNINTPDGLENLKHWLYDHGNGSTYGGVACFGANITGAEYVTLPAGTPQENKTLLINWGTGGSHGMTIVGYDDTVCYDINRDGRYTNDIDTNGDGIVDMRDWEIGALLMANSWGTGYCDQGFCYIAYRSISSMFGAEAYIVIPEPVYQPKMVLKATLSHPSRSDLSIFTSVFQNGQEIIKHYENMFSFSGGSYPMCGQGNDSPIEIGLDITSLYEQIDPQQGALFNLNVYESDYNNEHYGEIISCSLIDYTSGQPVERICPQTNVPIAQDTRTMATIAYNMPPQPLRVQYVSYDTNAQSNLLLVNMRIYNDGQIAVPLSSIHAKYWYTLEGTQTNQNIALSYAGLYPEGQPVTNVAQDIATIDQGGQNRAIIIGFAGSENIQPGGYVEVKCRVNKDDWSFYTQTNDYSFGSHSSFIDWPKITAYVDDTLVWGIEP